MLRKNRICGSAIGHPIFSMQCEGIMGIVTHINADL